MRVLELFCGIGGAAAALHGHGEIVAAVDHDRDALATYATNFPHRVVVKNVAPLKPAWFAGFDADLWWMSPPCQPHGIRGAQRDLDDPRSAAFLAVIGAIRAVRPRYVALENVPWFEGSAAHALLRDALAGYTVRERQLCPTMLGIPNERRRFYLVAGDALRDWDPPVARRVPLAAFLDPAPTAGLDVDEGLRARFGDAFHVVDADDPRAVAACFTAAYGRSPVYCGSYVRQYGRLRRFSADEIARLHGFGAGFRFAPGLSDRRRYAQVGHALSVPSVREVLTAIPGY
jgi:DNA (cytosine-5)-methyltransferase 1